MSSAVCTCGAADVDVVDEEIVGLPENAIIDRLAIALRLDAAVVRRVVFGAPIVLPLEDAERLVAYQQREAIAAAKRRQAKSDARAAAISAAQRRAER